MPRLISFHPVDPEFFDGLVQPLVAGRKVNPDLFIEMAQRLRRTVWRTARYKEALRELLERAAPPPPPEEGTMWEKVRARLERFDHRPEPIVRLVATKIEPDLHLDGRPFLITEGSADRVGAVTDDFLAAAHDRDVDALVRKQLARIGAQLAEQIEPVDVGEPPADMHYRRELLESLKEIHDLAQAARSEEAGEAARGRREPANQILARELAWRAVLLHSRAVPFWHGEEVDGLGAISRAAGLEPSGCLVPAWPLFAEVLDEFPVLRESLGVELGEGNSVGAYVAPSDLDELIAFLNSNGAAIIRVATRHGEGEVCKTLLRKIRECAHYARRRGAGFLEASGIPLLDPEVEEHSGAHL